MDTFGNIKELTAIRHESMWSDIDAAFEQKEKCNDKWKPLIDLNVSK